MRNIIIFIIYTVKKYLAQFPFLYALYIYFNCKQSFKYHVPFISVSIDSKEFLWIDL